MKQEEINKSWTEEITEKNPGMFFHPIFLTYKFKVEWVDEDTGEVLYKSVIKTSAISREEAGEKLESLAEERAWDLEDDAVEGNVYFDYALVDVY